MDKLEQFMREKCANPTRIVKEAEKSGGYFQDYVEPVPLSLAHIIESFKKTRIRLNLTDSGVVSYRSLDTASLLSFLCDWVFVRADGDQAWFHDQTPHTRLSFCKLHGYEE